MHTMIVTWPSIKTGLLIAHWEKEVINNDKRKLGTIKQQSDSS